MIIKSGNKFKVVSKNKKRSFGTYNTKPEAEKRLKQIEYFKHLLKEFLLKKSYQGNVSSNK